MDMQVRAVLGGAMLAIREAASLASIAAEDIEACDENDEQMEEITYEWLTTEHKTI